MITKALSRTDYAVKQAHVELAERMRVRDPGTAPNVGDRVPYVIVKGTKGAKAYERAEDPLYALENNIPIDAEHYLEHQIRNPLMDIFEPIMSNPAQLISGDHTRSITMLSSTASGIAKFTVKQQRCMGCNSVLGRGGTLLSLSRSHALSRSLLYRGRWQTMRRYASTASQWRP